MGKTSIEWTDQTWNPVVGCDRISPGCAHCYAKEVHDRRHKAALEGKDVAEQYQQPFEVVQLKPDRLADPLSWRKPRRVFVNSVSDLFHEDVPDEYIDQVFAVMALCRWRHTFQVLTKRAQRMKDYATAPFRTAAIWQFVLRMNPLKKFLAEEDRPKWPLQNVWLGVSVENQRFADERIPLLLQTPAAIRFVSAEPLLGPVDFERGEWLNDDAVTHDHLCGLDWVIVGAESGPGARPFDLAWPRSILAQCRDAGVAAFVKQLGKKPTCNGCGDYIAVFGSKDRKGGDPAEWPEDLRVREFPQGDASN